MTPEPSSPGDPAPAVDPPSDGATDPSSDGATDPSSDGATDPSGDGGADPAASSSNAPPAGGDAGAGRDPHRSPPSTTSPWDTIQEKLATAAAPRYRVLRLLGYGGMAGVYLADEPRLARRVVIKVMSPALLMDQNVVERFQQEARTIAQLSHPNIVSVFDVDERDGLHFFAMSYVPGRSLAQVMAEGAGPLPVAVVRTWLYQVGDALAYAHRAGVIHRDVKPGNILLDAEGNALVGDFGIAKVSDEPGLTRTGLLVGTPAYMSPEQCTGGKLTGASDQYSLGVVAYQLLTGRAPFSGATLEVLQAHVNERPTPIADLRPDCPPELLEAVERMLAKRPDERWPSMSAAAAAVGAAVPGVDDPVREEMRMLAVRSAGVAVAGAPASLREGESRSLRVLVTDEQGRPLEGRRVQWAAADPSVAWVRGDTVVALRPGRARITGTCGDGVATIELEVEPDPVGAVEVEPDRVELGPGGSTSLRPVVRAADGTVLDDRAVLWASSDPEIAAISPDGVVTALRPGNAVVMAMTGERTATASLTVTEAAPAAAPAGAGAAAGGAAYGRGATPSPGSATGRATGPGAHRARRPALLAGGAAVVILAAAAVIYLPGRGDAPATGVQPVTPEPGQAGDAGFTPPGVPAGDTVDVAIRDAAPPGAPDAGPGAVAGTPPADGEPGPPAAPATVEPADPAAPAPAPPATGTVVVQGPLPDGAAITLVAADGRAVPLAGDSAVVPPGQYRFEATAPGHEPVAGQVTVVAGVRVPLVPSLRPLAVAPPPEPQPQPAPGPGAGAAADAAAVQTAVRAFVADVAARRAEPVLPLLPADARSGWQFLLTDRSITNWAVASETVAAPEIQGDRAVVDFGFDLSYRAAGRTDQRPLRFRGELERSAGDWRLVSVRSLE